MNRLRRVEAVKGALAEQWRHGPSGRLEIPKGKRTLVALDEPGLIRDSVGASAGVDVWVRLYEADGREVPIDPHRRIVNPPTVSRNGAGPAAAFWEAVWDSVEETPNPDGWNSGTVTTVFGDATDGRLEGQSATYATARQGTGTINVDTTGVTSATGQFFSSTYSCYEQFWAFDTSPVPVNDAVSAVVFALWMVTDVSTTDFTIEVREKAWVSPLTSADYVSGTTLGNFTQLASLATSGIGAAGYKNFTSVAAFLTATNLKTGTVKIFTSSSRHRLGNTPTTTEYVQFSTADTSGTTQDPKLTITHSTPPFQGWGVPV